MAENKFPLTDVHQAAWLELHRIRVTLTRQDNGKVLFEALADAETFATLKAFEENTEVPVRTFTGYLKNLRHRMIEVRDGKTGDRRNGSARQCHV
jgi:hypothetical protein